LVEAINNYQIILQSACFNKITLLFRRICLSI
jgi:hypothetical protein